MDLKSNIRNRDCEMRRIIEKVKILVVEDESIVAEDIKSSLMSMGYEVPSQKSSTPATARTLFSLTLTLSRIVIGIAKSSFLTWIASVQWSWLPRTAKIPKGASNLFSALNR